MRKTVFQQKYEEECVLNKSLSTLLAAKNDEIDRLKKDNDTYARMIERKNSETVTARNLYEQQVTKNQVLEIKVEDLEEKVQTLLATVHLLARAADKDPSRPIDPTF